MPKSLAILMGLLAATTGCSSSIAHPDWLHPGSLKYQRWRAEIFDPYPQQDLGTPIIGARPPQFQSAPEPQRNGPALFNRFGPEPAKEDIQPIL